MNKNNYRDLPIYKNQNGKYLLKKDIVNNFPENFGLNKKEEYEYATTSGTTSDRMEIIRTKNWWKDEYVRTYSNNEKLNKYLLDDDLHKIIFTTAQCSNLICFIDKPPMEKRIIGKTLYVNNTFNPWTWTKEDIEQITNEINYFKPYYMDADPVYLSVYLFLKEKYKIKTKLHNPKIITLSYEFVTNNYKNYIKKFFAESDILNLYGTTEFGYIFLEENNKMKLCRDLVNVKLLEINKKNNLYTLIIDSFKNKYMPLINYRVGDMVIATNDQVKEFEEKGIVEKMAGREKDLIDSKISYSMIDDIISTISNSILFYQLYMISENMFIFKYIKENNKIISEIEETKIKEELKKIGIKFDLKFRMVEEISPEMSGKFAIIKRNI